MIVNATFMNDVMRAVVCIPGLFSILEQFPPAHSRKTLYRHAEYATEHTTAYISLTTLMISKRLTHSFSVVLVSKANAKISCTIFSMLKDRQQLPKKSPRIIMLS